MPWFNSCDRLRIVYLRQCIRHVEEHRRVRASRRRRACPSPSAATSCCLAAADRFSSAGPPGGKPRFRLGLRDPALRAAAGAALDDREMAAARRAGRDVFRCSLCPCRAAGRTDASRCGLASIAAQHAVRSGAKSRRSARAVRSTGIDAATANSRIRSDRSVAAHGADRSRR